MPDKMWLFQVIGDGKRYVINQIFLTELKFCGETQKNSSTQSGSEEAEENECVRMDSSTLMQ